MYEAFFGLRERPFELAPNPRFLLLTSSHAEALSNLEYGITGKKGITVLLGEAGTGKTTLIRTALQKWRTAGHLVAYINNPTLSRVEFVECLAEAFDLGPEAAASKTRLLASLTELVMRRHEQGLLTGLLIDEAQALSDELLEEIRLLANVETADEKVFPVVLAGQPELAGRLNAPGLRQLKQRIGLRCVLAPLDVREVGAYISGRVRLAGGVGAALFTREAVISIHEHSGGIPRVINVICDNVLLSAFATQRRPATREIVEEVCRDFDLVASATTPSAKPPAPAAKTPARGHGPAAKTAPANDSDSVFESVPARIAPGPHPEEGERPLFGMSNPKRKFSLFRWRESPQ